MKETLGDQTHINMQHKWTHMQHNFAEDSNSLLHVVFIGNS